MIFLIVGAAIVLLLFVGGGAVLDGLPGALIAAGTLLFLGAVVVATGLIVHGMEAL